MECFLASMVMAKIETNTSKAVGGNHMEVMDMDNNLKEVMDMDNNLKEVMVMDNNHKEVMDMDNNHKVAKGYLLKSHLNQNYLFYLHNHQLYKILNLMQKKLDKREEVVVNMEIGDHKVEIKDQVNMVIWVQEVLVLMVLKEIKDLMVIGVRSKDFHNNKDFHSNKVIHNNKDSHNNKDTHNNKVIHNNKVDILKGNQNLHMNIL
jgi:hypothetical protein